VFIWQELNPKQTYHHQVMRDFHEKYGLTFYHMKRSIWGFVLQNGFFLVGLILFSLTVLAIPLITMFSVMVRWTFNNRWALFALFTYIVLVSGLAMETYMQPHYLAPVSGYNYVFVLQAMRLCRRRNKNIGRIMLWLVPSLCLVVLLFSPLYERIKKDESVAWHSHRTHINEQLNRMGGQHLIIVTYGSRHSFLDEWVYNEADIDSATVAFARAIDNPQDCQLIKYFRSRQIWSLEVDGDQSSPKLKPYPTSLC
jgi:hypothetical protein